MFRSAARLSIAFTALAVVAPTVLSASEVVPAAAAGTPDTPPSPQILVMNNGDLVEGAITRTQTGYELAQPGGGRMFLAESFVWFAANSRQDAYDELQRRYPDQSAGGHVALARWCLRYGLKDAAQDQLQIALTIDPDHAEARGTLKFLGKKPTTPIPDPTTPAQATRDPRATLGGLPPETARAFVTTVQPILVNGCGNASCHGTSSKNAFTIQNVRSNNPAFKTLTQRNLETVRGRISADDPAHSEIFMKPQQPGHGGSRRPIIGATQLRTLQAWAVDVARTMPRTEQKAATTPAALVLTSNSQDAAAPSAGEVPAASHEESGATSDGRRDVADVLRQAIAEERADAFDPREFNRRFGPDAGRPTPPASEGPSS